MTKEKVQLTIVVIGFVDSDVPTTTNMKTAEKEIQKVNLHLNESILLSAMC